MKALAIAAVALCLAGAAWQVSKVEPGSVAVCSSGAKLSAVEVEKSFGEESALIAAGHEAEASILLEKKAKAAGPQRGAALFLLGEVAFDAGAASRAVERYAEALKADPTLADGGAPFGAEKKMLARARALREGAWQGKEKGSAEMAKLSALERRLTGGCK